MDIDQAINEEKSDKLYFDNSLKGSVPVGQKMMCTSTHLSSWQCRLIMGGFIPRQNCKTLLQQLNKNQKINIKKVYNSKF